MIGLVHTQSPGPTPSARQARCSALVALLTATASAAPQCAASARSNAGTAGPWVRKSERRTSTTAWMSSSLIVWRPYGVRPGETMIYTYPTEAFMLYIRIALIAGLFISAPLIFWQVWLFVAPALYTRERRYAIPFVMLSSIGVIAGAAFSHYVAFPLMWRFFASFSNDLVSFMPRIEDAFSVYMRMLLGMAVVFQMPAMVFFLARMGVVTARWMIRQFKYAVLVIVVIAAIITPAQTLPASSSSPAPWSSSTC